MAKRGGLKNKIIKRIAHIKWLLYTNKTPPPWATAQKLTAELDFLKETLQQRKPQTATHSARIEIINNKVKKKPPSPKPLPKKPAACPNDCPGPLYSPFCESTCLRKHYISGKKSKTCAKTSTGPGHQQ